MQSFNSNGNCVENYAKSTCPFQQFVIVSHSEHTSSLVFGSSPFHFYTGSIFQVWRTLKTSNFLLSPPQPPKTNPTEKKHKQTRAAFLDSRLTVFSRFYKTSSFFRMVRDRAESQVNNKELTTKLQFISVFFCSGWGIYMKDILLSLHDKTVTNIFFLRYKYSYRGVLWLTSWITRQRLLHMHWPTRTAN